MTVGFLNLLHTKSKHHLQNRQKSNRASRHSLWRLLFLPSHLQYAHRVSGDFSSTIAIISRWSAMPTATPTRNNATPILSPPSLFTSPFYWTTAVISCPCSDRSKISQMAWTTFGALRFPFKILSIYPLSAKSPVYSISHRPLMLSLSPADGMI